MDLSTRIEAFVLFWSGCPRTNILRAAKALVASEPIDMSAISVISITYRGGHFGAVTTQVNTRLAPPTMTSRANPAQGRAVTAPEYFCMRFWAKRYIIWVKSVLSKWSRNIASKFEHLNTFIITTVYHKRQYICAETRCY